MALRVPNSRLIRRASPMSDAIFSALHHLALVRLEAGVLTEEQIGAVADGVESDAQDVPAIDRHDFEWAAHVLRWAIVETEDELPQPPTLPLRIVDNAQNIQTGTEER